MLWNMLDGIRQRRPLVHSITSCVTANDCASVVLACGASPIMADAPEEVAEVTERCASLSLSLGVMSRRTAESMLIAGRRASELGHPIVFDPVGVGASSLRADTAARLLKEVKLSVIRGNVSELKALALGGSMRGVDADAADAVTEAELGAIVSLAKAYALKAGAVVAVTGAIDVVTDGCCTYCIRNGHPMMSSVTGTGCQLTAMTAAFAAAYPRHPLEAAVAATVMMGYAGEVAFDRLTGADGIASYKRYIIDAIFNMTPEMLEKGARYEVR